MSCFVKKLPAGKIIDDNHFLLESRMNFLKEKNKFKMKCHRHKVMIICKTSME